MFYLIVFYSPGCGTRNVARSSHPHLQLTQLILDGAVIFWTGAAALTPGPSVGQTCVKSDVSIDLKNRPRDP